MMNFLRKGIFSGVFLALLLLAGFSLVLTDWTGSFRSGTGSNNVARIGHDQISQMEFARRVDRSLRAQNIPAAQAYQMGLINQILTGIIWENLLTHAAWDFGLAIDDTTLLSHLKTLTQDAAAQQKTTPAEVLKRFIFSQGIGEQEFLDATRGDMTRGMVRTLVTQSGTTLNPLMMADLARAQAQTRDIDILVLKDNRIKEGTTPGDVVINDLYEKRKNEFLIPEKRDIHIAVLTPRDLEKFITITEPEIKELYDSSTDTLEQPEKRALTIAVFKTEKSASAFATLVKTTPASFDSAKKKHGAISVTDDIFAQDDLPDDMVSPAFHAGNGDIIGPFQTPLGFQVARIGKTIPAGVPSMDRVRDSLVKQLKEDRMNDLRDKLVEDINTAADSSSSLSEVIKPYALSILKIENLTRVKEAPSLTQAVGKENLDPVLAALFGTSTRGSVLPPIELKNGAIVLAEVTSITDATPKPLADIREKLISDWQAEERSRLNTLEAQALYTDLADHKKSMAKLAAESGLDVLSLKAATRFPKELPTGLDYAAYNRLFTAESEKPVFTSIPQGLVIAVVRGIHIPAKAQETKELIQKTINSQSEEMMVQFLGALNDRTPAEINQRLLDQMFATKGEQTP